MSSSDIAVSVRGVSKSYTIAHDAEKHVTLAEAALARVRNPLKRATKETFWALNDVSFDVKKGDVVGIIGRNGAGKSTLLKILSRITGPTTGEIEMKGRIGSLLEVGTGFHPELTGRENIFLNGAILGMRKPEIKKQFDAIVDFSGCEQFLDTPVKRYSSGMYVRLAFAVAAHLSTEILVVDEVLSVGDAEFQKKCLGKMGEVAKAGRTVLFVSHNMLSVARLCRRAIMLQTGRLIEVGPAQNVVHNYLRNVAQTAASREWGVLEKAPGDDIVRMRSVRIRDGEGNTTATPDIRETIVIELIFDVLEPGAVLVPNYHFFNDEGLCLFIAQDLDDEWRARPRPPGRYTNLIRVPGNFFSEGMIIVGVAITTFSPWNVRFFEREAVAFQIQDNGCVDSARGDYPGHLPGIVRPLLHASTKYEPARPEAIRAPQAECYRKIGTK